MSPEFLLTSLIVVLMPGTGVLYTLATGLARGWRASMLAAVGCTLGILPHILAALTGLAALLHTSAVAFQALKIAGVAYLLFMAWSTLRDRSGPSLSDGQRAPAPASPWRLIRSGFLLNVLNPKLSIFFLAFLPQFVAPDAPGAVGQMLQLSLVFMGLTFIVFVGYGACASAVRRQVVGHPQVMAWFRRVFAGAFVLLGLRLALADR